MIAQMQTYLIVEHSDLRGVSKMAELKYAQIKNQIIGDGTYGSKLINGELIKVIISAKTNAEIKIWTSDGELIFDGEIFDGPTVIYPKNSENGDNYYLLGSFIVEVKGLEDENTVPNIKFIYYGN